MAQHEPRDTSRGVYGISVAAELAGLGVQTLRLYETRGLLEPDRSVGRTRLYSDDDIALLQHIADLVDGGLNIAGIAAVLELEHANQLLRQQLASAKNNTSSQGKRRSPSVKKEQRS